MLLEVSGLRVAYPARGGEVAVVRGVDLAVAPGECLGIVGESGSGKSQTMLAILGLAGPGARVSGSAIFAGEELVGMPQSRLQGLRGDRIGLVFQDSITGLTPHMRIGDQLAEVLVVHRGASPGAARAEALQMLEVLQIPEPAYRLGQYPHELSGGMRQRVMIAMALLCRPALLIADEPTTALDTTVQAAILRSFAKLKAHAGTALVLISHDLGVVAGLADRVAVMYAGRIVESAPAEQLFATPRHPYTKGLLASMPRLDGPPGGPLPAIEGQPPDPAAVADTGCAFAPRCGIARPACMADLPQPAAVGPAHRVACHAVEPA